MKIAKETQSEIRSTPDYDSAWKEVIEEHFEAFLEFFFPRIHKDIDFSKGFEILSKELRRIIPKGQIGDREVDVLMKAYLKEGEPKFFCVLIHVEVQGTQKVSFMDRIFVYFYRIFEKFRKKGMEVVTLAILTDENENYRPRKYHFSRWGFVHMLIIPLVKIIDYKNKKELSEKLETATNPFALAVKVQLKSMEVTNKEIDKKFNIKRELIREYYKHGYDKKYIRSLLTFIDLIFPLPEDLEKIVSEDIAIFEEEQKMKHVLSWERIAKKEGLKEGIKEGLKEGKWDVVKMSLKEGLPIKTIERITGFPAEEINRFKEKVMQLA
jgi:predicted transposase/invertase (TIGR01784 family)